MPVTKSTEFAIQEAGKFLARINDKRRIESTLQWAKCEVILVGDETNATNITLIRLPDNAIVRPEHCYVVCNDPGTALTGTVGDAGDNDRYSGTLTLDAGGRVPFIATAAVAFPDGFNNEYRVTGANKDVVFDIATVNTLTAGAKLYFFVAYSCL